MQTDKVRRSYAHTALIQEPNPAPDDLAFLQYTSGSTSAPKGYVLEVDVDVDVDAFVWLGVYRRRVCCAGRFVRPQNHNLCVWQFNQPIKQHTDPQKHNSVMVTHANLVAQIRLISMRSTEVGGVDWCGSG